MNQKKMKARSLMKKIKELTNNEIGVRKVVGDRLNEVIIALNELIDMHDFAKRSHKTGLEFPDQGLSSSSDEV